MLRALKAFAGRGQGRCLKRLRERFPNCLCPSWLGSELRLESRAPFYIF
jgi:hypothetical protein